MPINPSLTEDDLQDAIRAEMRALHEYALAMLPGPGEFTVRDYADENGLTYSRAGHELDTLVFSKRATMRKGKMNIYKFAPVV